MQNKMFVWCLTFCLLLGAAISDCPNGWVRHDDSCYKLFASTRATWAEAFVETKVPPLASKFAKFFGVEEKFWISKQQSMIQKPTEHLYINGQNPQIYYSLYIRHSVENMYCQVFSSDMVVIDTAREQNFIEGFLRREFKPGMPDGVWIGGTDSLVEGEWVWIKTGASINQQEFKHWYPGEPNSSGATGEDCMDLLHHENYNWNDERCEVLNNFLCEKQAISGENIIG